MTNMTNTTNMTSLTSWPNDICDVTTTSNTTNMTTTSNTTNMTSWPNDIRDMHTKFGVREVVKNFDREKMLTFLKFRLDFLQEELNEAQEAYNVLNAEQAGMQEDAKVKYADDIVDAMIDLSVVAIGTLDAFGIDAQLSWDRVHDANMQKEPGIKASRPNPLGLPDLIKPEGWVAPTHSDNIGLLAKL